MVLDRRVFPPYLNKGLAQSFLGASHQPLGKSAAKEDNQPFLFECAFKDFLSVLTSYPDLKWRVMVSSCMHFCSEQYRLHNEWLYSRVRWPRVSFTPTCSTPLNTVRKKSGSSPLATRLSPQDLMEFCKNGGTVKGINANIIVSKIENHHLG